MCPRPLKSTGWGVSNSFQWKWASSSSKGKNKQPTTSSQMPPWQIASCSIGAINAECISWLTKRTMSEPFRGIHITLGALRLDLALQCKGMFMGFYHSIPPTPGQLCFDRVRLGKLESNPGHWSHLDRMSKITNGCSVFIKSQTSSNLPSYA